MKKEWVILILAFLAWLAIARCAGCSEMKDGRLGWRGWLILIVGSATLVGMPSFGFGNNIAKGVAIPFKNRGFDKTEFSIESLVSTKGGKLFVYDDEEGKFYDWTDVQLPPDGIQLDKSTHKVPVNHRFRVAHENGKLVVRRIR